MHFCLIILLFSPLPTSFMEFTLSAVPWHMDLREVITSVYKTLNTQKTAQPGVGTLSGYSGVPCSRPLATKCAAMAGASAASSCGRRGSRACGTCYTPYCWAWSVGGLARQDPGTTPARPRQDSGKPWQDLLRKLGYGVEGSTGLSVLAVSRSARFNHGGWVRAGA